MSKTHFADDATLALIAKFEAENAALKREQVAYDKEIDRLQASNSALRVDAERYRFIRNYDAWGIFDHKRGAELDAAIDAARKERP